MTRNWPNLANLAKLADVALLVPLRWLGLGLNLPKLSVPLSTQRGVGRITSSSSASATQV